MRKTAIFIGLFMLLPCLSACVSMQERSANECAALGMAEGTPAYANCYEQAMARRQSLINAAISSSN